MMFGVTLQRKMLIGWIKLRWWSVCVDNIRIVLHVCVEIITSMCRNVETIIIYGIKLVNVVVF